MSLPYRCTPSISPSARAVSNLSAGQRLTGVNVNGTDRMDSMDTLTCCVAHNGRSAPLSQGGDTGSNPVGAARQECRSEGISSDRSLPRSENLGHIWGTGAPDPAQNTTCWWGTQGGCHSCRRSPKTPAVPEGLLAQLGIWVGQLMACLPLEVVDRRGRLLRPDRYIRDGGSGTTLCPRPALR
jgi:hypothetical protein